MSGTAAYTELERRFARLHHIESAGAVLDWDSQTMMPVGGAGDRAEQTAALALVCHELLTDTALAGLLDRAEADESAALGPWQAANLAEMRRLWTHANAVEARLVEALSKATSACEMTWRTARPAGDFASFAPLLAEVVRLTRESGAARGEALGVDAYDALIDGFDPGSRAAAIDPVFDTLADFLPDLIAAAIERQEAAAPALPIEGHFSVESQRKLAHRMMETLGFDFAHGRLDVSDHPFTGGTPGDVRITTRYSEDDFAKGLMAVLHETGHAMYELGLPGEWRHQPVGRAPGMSLHESQSLIVEMQACRNPGFIGYAAPIMRETFGGGGPAWEAENIHAIYTRIERGFIRVDADEVTYPAHILLRYRLEKALIAGDLAISDLPGAWNEALRDLLGITPGDDGEGCMQDIHWAVGLFGYFPSYTLGAMTAAQLFDAAKRADGDIEPGIARGDFAPLFRWLRANVHGHGASLTPAELLTRATGNPLDPAIFRSHLEARYLG